MKNYSKLLLTVISTVALLFLSCEKEKKFDPKDSVNHPAFKIFHCKVDGEWLVPRCADQDPAEAWDFWNYSPCRPLICQVNPDVNAVRFWVSDVYNSGNFDLLVRFEKLGEPTHIVYRGLRFTGGGNYCYAYRLDTTHNNTVTVVKLDEDSRTVEGYFDFWVVTSPQSVKYNKCPSDTIHVSEGYFNAKYSGF